MTVQTAEHEAWRSQFTPAEMAAMQVNDGARTIMVNRPPAITWHKLKINEVPVQLPAPKLVANASRVQVEAPRGVQVVEDASAFDAVLAEADTEKHWETGLGAEAVVWMRQAEARHVFVEVPAGFSAESAINVYVDAEDGVNTVAAIDVVVRAGARASMALHTDSPQGGTGVAGVALRVLLEEGARLDIDTLQTLDESYTYLENIAGFAQADAHVNMLQTALGSGRGYAGFALDLEGDRAETKVDTHYLGHGEGLLDFNYIIRQRGKNTRCVLDANGVLAEKAKKTLRGTIDLIHGGKGSVGREKETVLLASPDVRNKTIPVILCDEDDVQGDHGATIGHVNPEQLEYLQTRGLSEEQIEDLFIGAQFDYASAHVSGARALVGINRLSQRVIGREANLDVDEGEE